MTRGTNERLTMCPEHLDVAAEPHERHAVAAPLETDEAVPAHAAGDDYVKGLADPTQRLQVLTLRTQCLFHAGRGGGAAHRRTRSVAARSSSAPCSGSRSVHSRANRSPTWLRNVRTVRSALPLS
jgi:hypothetical protein